MFENKKILILGMARSGIAAAKLLIKRNNQVIINDIKDNTYYEEEMMELEELGCHVILGSHPDDLLDSSFDYLIKNPGIRSDHKYIKKAKELGIEVINEVELAYLIMPKDITLIGITGTNGKTTTTTLTYEILHKAFGDRVHLAGNIGYPLCNILPYLKKNDIVVMEVSVQQSMDIKKFHPHIALITNYSPAHIDFLGTYENYKKVKAKMFYNQEKGDIAILNLCNSEVLDEMKNIKSQKKYFISNDTNTNCYLKDNIIYYQDKEILKVSDIKIPGIHNIENIQGAISIAKEFNVSNEVIYDVISNFKGVEHRLEYVDTINGVRFYNDTEATNIKCTQIALSSFENSTILILGGLERGQNFDDLSDYVKNVKAIIAIGECRERVKAFSEKEHLKCYVFEHLKDSFDIIMNIIKKNDVVLLSPASASWDQYKECEERGYEFKKLVGEYKNGSIKE